MSDDEIPPVITTAHLLLRGLVPAFVGCSISDDVIYDVANGNNDDSSAAAGKKGGGVQASAFQMTYRKDLPKLGNDGEWSVVL